MDDALIHVMTLNGLDTTYWCDQLSFYWTCYSYESHTSEPKTLWPCTWWIRLIISHQCCCHHYKTVNAKLRVAVILKTAAGAGVKSRVLQPDESESEARGSLGAPRELTITFKQSSEIGPTVKHQEGVGGCVGITVAPNLTGLIGSALNVLEPPHILLNPCCGRSELVLVVQEAPRAN